MAKINTTAVLAELAPIQEVDRRPYTLYMLINKINNKKYVGQTCDRLERRWSNHVSFAKMGKGRYLASAIRKYGSGGFVVLELDRVPGVEAANEREQELISLFDLMDRKKGYNCTTGGGNGFQMSPETIKKMSESLKARHMKLSPFQKQALHKANFGKTRPKEVVDKIAFANSRKDVPSVWVYDLYVRGGFSTFDIADMLDCTQATVWKRLNDVKAPMRPSKGDNLPQFKKFVLAEDVRRLYVDEKMNLEDVGAALGTTKSTIVSRLKSLDIHPRTRSESLLITWERRKNAINSNFK